MSAIRANKQEIDRAAGQYTSYFEDSANIPISFTLEGQTFCGFGADFEIQRELLPAGCQVGTEFDQLRTYKYLSDYGEKITARHKSGITAVVKTAVYKDYAAFEWAVTFRNDADSNSPLLGDILAADLTFTGANPYLQHFVGDDGTDSKAMMPQETLLRPGSALEFQPVGGRPTNFQLPFYRLTAGEHSTVISVGWAGQWKSRFDTLSSADCVHFSAGQACIRARLLPGEEIRTPMITLLFANCRADLQEGEYRLINLWRRFLIDCNMRRIRGELMQPVATANTFMMYHEMLNSTDENQIQALDAYHNAGICLDYWWMDAGWYFKGEDQRITSWDQVGSWKVDTNRFPSEFRAISDHAARLGTKTLLWFEPERVTPGTGLADKPEWLVSPRLADMGNPEFRSWLTDRVLTIMKKGGISLYRQDFNIDPLPHWQQKDAQCGPDRIGICENHYVTGYLAYWDSLIARAPEMMIDSCASGGRRNDLETMRRSIAIHKTDSDYSDLTQKQSMHHSFFQWLPYFGTLALGRGPGAVADRYNFRTAFVPWMAYTYDVSRTAEENDYATGVRALQEWREIGRAHV